MISIDEFMQFVNDSPVVRFQYWWSDADDVYCRLQREYDLTCLEFALEGTTTEQEQKIWDCLKPLFISLTEHSVALLLILDRIGRTFEYQWKEIALGQIQLVGPYPDEMIVPTTFECLKSLDATQMQCIQLTPRAIAIRSTM